MTDFDRIALPLLIPFMGIVVWLVTFSVPPAYKTKKEALIMLLWLLVWPAWLVVLGLCWFYDSWSKLEDE
jgi:chromate transport protein ChrA